MGLKLLKAVKNGGLVTIGVEALACREREAEDALDAWGNDGQYEGRVESVRYAVRTSVLNSMSDAARCNTN